MVLPAYTMEQMEDKALIAIQYTGLFSQAILDWNRLPLENKTWSDLKAHFCGAYEAYLATGAVILAQHGYANNVTEANDDESLDMIRVFFATLIMANNATVQGNNDSMA